MAKPWVTKDKMIDALPRGSSEEKRSTGSIANTLRDVASVSEDASRVVRAGRTIGKKQTDGLGLTTLLAVGSTALAAIGTLITKATPMMTRLAEIDAEKIDRRARRSEDRRRPRSTRISFSADTKICTEDRCIEGKKEFDSGRAKLRLSNGETLERCDLVDGRLSCELEGKMFTEKETRE